MTTDGSVVLKGAQLSEGLAVWGSHLPEQQHMELQGAEPRKGLHNPYMEDPASRVGLSLVTVVFGLGGVKLATGAPHHIAFLWEALPTCGFFVPGGEHRFAGETPSLLCIFLLLILLLLLCVSYSIVLYVK